MSQHPSPPRRPTSRTARPRVQPLNLMTAILIIVGTAVGLYPVAASWGSALLQTQEADRYVTTVGAFPPAQRAADLAAAAQYNATLADGSHLVDPFTAVAEKTVTTNDPYWSLLDPSGDGVMARLRIPSLDLQIPIVHGTAEDALLTGVGHLQGSALPVGGATTHSVLTGHRGLPQAEMFTHLDKLGVGDMIELDVYDQILVYQVTATTVVLPEETASLRAEAGKDLLSLVTCTPLGVNSHRIIVTAQRILPTPADAGAPVDPVGFPWWAPAFLAVVLGCTLYVVKTRVPRATASDATASDAPTSDAPTPSEPVPGASTGGEPARVRGRRRRT